jgi:hypothetical protein
MSDNLHLYFSESWRTDRIKKRREIMNKEIKKYIIIGLGIILLIVLGCNEQRIAIKSCVASGNSENYCMEHLK